jgi:hypothetical protein
LPDKKIFCQFEQSHSPPDSIDADSRASYIRIQDYKSDFQQKGIGKRARKEGGINFHFFEKTSFCA